ncbi:MAG: MBL fold metallo-hydrolase [Candidatus Nealsonbacteria bacterium CG01_land_8_20_14_3_00_12]|uniref:MBL fold metallo-hydrolase n=1 Tax=Candidatus Nealsonbacteria bacterium CG01_land_8_20_14_3_00_12 TaxID=1974697 RepID=A0A2M7EC13_9BACT|nr:MAG: MBL fold metallo-hydrolase [Candidatus Nealsonbacteria bacterium CG01_land_8_20_14_3_00_12]
MSEISHKRQQFELEHLIVGPLLTNCYILISKGEALVIDPGGGLKRILKEIEKAKLKYIVLTHCHWDHFLAAPKLKRETGAKILIHEEEKAFIKFNVDQFLKNGDEIGYPPFEQVGEISLKVIHTPGHTKGSICLAGKDFIFTGDTIFEDGYGRTDLSGGSQKDLENSLKKLEKILKPGTKIYPGHGPPFKKSA